MFIQYGGKGGSGGKGGRSGSGAVDAPFPAPRLQANVRSNCPSNLALYRTDGELILSNRPTDQPFSACKNWLDHGNLSRPWVLTPTQDFGVQLCQDVRRHSLWLWRGAEPQISAQEAAVNASHKQINLSLLKPKSMPIKQTDQ
eukprot:649016-Pelagomonas_calceolata.AAC.2